jgi:hypothetical protein
MKTPNCNQCEWLTTMKSIDKKNPKMAACSAQGYKYAITAYNTKECKKLYIVRELEK